jgi:hypothetical protein
MTPVHRLLRADASLAALSLAGCSGSFGGLGNPTPAPSDAAWVLNMTGAGSACPLMVSTGQLGDVNDQIIDAKVTDQMKGAAGVATVKCSVVPVGSGLHVSGAAGWGCDELQIDVPSITKTASKASPASGSVSYLSETTVSTFSGMCNFYFSGNEGIGPGKVWLSFTCPGLTASGSISTCPVAESYVLFEDCATM